jgi:enoyl-[acyl-carrier protein] reductase III
VVIKADIGSLEGIESLFGEVESTLGGLDILVCNAASGYNRPVMEQKPKGWEWTMNINARSLLFAAQRAVPLMEQRGGGAIVSLSSPGAACAARLWWLAPAKLPGSVPLPGGQISSGTSSSTQFPRRGDTEPSAFRCHARRRAAERIRSQTPAGRMVTPEDVAGWSPSCAPAAL